MWRKGRWDVALVWKVSPKQSTDERSMWAPEGSALQAEGTAPGWDRTVWEQRGGRGGGGAELQVMGDKASGKTGVRWASGGVEWHWMLCPVTV